MSYVETLKIKNMYMCVSLPFGDLSLPYGDLNLGPYPTYPINI